MADWGTAADVAGKQRELQQRDELCLEIARTVFLEEGYHSLTISRLAKATGFARPTLYERFNSKEALIVELGLRCQRELVSLLEKASAFPGRARERMVAIGAVLRHYFDRYADDMRIANFSGTDVVMEKVSADLQQQHTALDVHIFEILQNIIYDAERQGDLSLPEGISTQTLTLTLVALVNGLASVSRGALPLDQIEIEDPVEGVYRSVHVLFDGYGWRPLWREWDYDATERQASALVDAMALEPIHRGKRKRENRSVRRI